MFKEKSYSDITHAVYKKILKNVRKRSKEKFEDKLNGIILICFNAFSVLILNEIADDQRDNFIKNEFPSLCQSLEDILNHINYQLKNLSRGN